MPDNIHNLMTEILGEPVFNVIGSILDSATIAEEEIEMAIRRQPHQAPVLWDSFKVLIPRTFLLKFAGFNPALYRAHVQELLQRAIDGESFIPGTRAEMLCVLSEASMAYKLRHNPTFVMIRLFKDVLPDAYEKLRPDVDRLEIHEVYKGASDETLAELRHKTRDETRNHTPDLERWFWVTDDVKQAVLG